jgi:hypothetical protein
MRADIPGGLPVAVTVERPRQARRIRGRCRLRAAGIHGRASRQEAQIPLCVVLEISGIITDFQVMVLDRCPGIDREIRREVVTDNIAAARGPVLMRTDANPRRARTGGVEIHDGVVDDPAIAGAAQRDALPVSWLCSWNEDGSRARNIIR